MGDISADYASPGLRWSLLLEDHPGASYKATVAKASEFGVPPEWGADSDVCVVTITFPASSGLDPAVGFKSPENNKRTPDEWNTLVTKTLGRALKKAGYPDDVPDLKLVILWRRRATEIAQLASGVVTAALPADTTTVEQAADEAGKARGTVGGDDDGSAPSSVDDGNAPDDDEPVDAELVGDDVGNDATPVESSSTPAPARTRGAPTGMSEEVSTRHQEALNTAASAHVQPDLREWAKDRGITWARPGSDDDAEAVIAKVQELVEAKG